MNFNFLKKSYILKGPIELEKKLKKIKGQIHPEENYYLYNLSKNLNNNSYIIEIGSYKGKSTIALGLGAKYSKSKVYCIDPHINFIGVNGGVFGPIDLKDKINAINEFDLGEYIFPICLNSNDVGLIWNKSIDILWIDGDHTYKAVKNDYEMFSKHVRKAGYIIFHDSQFDGVTKCINEIDKTKYKLIDSIISMKIFQKL